MKRTFLLLIVLLISILFCSCFSLYGFFDSFYLEYDFLNKENKNVLTDRKGYSDEPAIIINDLKINFGLAEDYERKGKDIKCYYPFIDIIVSEDKYIDHVLINEVIIYAGKIKYSMLKRVKDVWLHIGLDKAYNLFLEKEEIADVQRTGLINHTISTDNESTFINAQKIFVGFSSVPIDSKYKKIRVLFDISVEYTTGEKIVINKEVTGLLKLKKTETTLWDYIWVP